MPGLALIALQRGEHKQLLEIWKFFPFSPENRYLYLYAGSAQSAAELPEHPSFWAEAFPGGRSSAVREMSASLHRSGIEQLCFASRSSFTIWKTELGLSAITLWSAKDLSLADISDPDGSVPCGLPDLLRELSPPFAVLRAEAGLPGLPPRIKSYPDFAAWQQGRRGETLLTANRDLISVLATSRIHSFRVSHHAPGLQACNLLLDDPRDRFQTTLSRLFEANQEGGARGRGAPPYSFFADYYDSYMAHVNYEEWIDLMLAWYRRFSPQPVRRVLELACGTANAAGILVFRGYEVDACDSSPGMLHQADAKIFKPHLFRATLTDPLPERGYDLIFCLFDSINYLTQSADLRALAKNVRASLRPGGIFIFDISTLRNSQENFRDSVSYTRVADGYLIHIAKYEALSNRQLTKLCLFQKSGTGYERLEERHVQRVYRCPELAALCSPPGLNLQAIFAPEARGNLLPKLNTGLDERYCRLFFLFQKDVQP